MSPFGHLVFHFIKRMVSGEGEEAEEGTSLGLGVALAILASPGAFASIFLFNKYSTLLQWLRGIRHFNFYRASAADEYFFVVLSMTITGLVMVMRWNRLFPDRRDFANLAALPIPIYHVFLANFVALLSLAFVFAVDVNLVSSILFPAIVTISDGSFGAFFKVAGGHWAAVLCASLFSFFAVFATVGLLMLLVPSRWLRPVAVTVRIVLVVGLLSEFFANLLLQLFAGKLPAEKLLPSFWFLGLYEVAIGIAKPSMTKMAEWALVALLVSIVVAVAAYALCYRRHFLRLAESFDSLGGSRHVSRFRMPAWLRRALFRSPFEEACDSFFFKVLSRSERHVMFLGGYVGIGMILFVQSGQPILLSFLLLSALRFAFDIPASLSSNWAFRFSVDDPQPTPRSVVRRFLFLIVLPWQIWSPINVAISILAIDLVMRNYHKIPFTYRVEADSRKLVMRIVLSMLTLVVAAPFCTWLGSAVARSWISYVVALALAAVAIYKLKPAEELPLSFEERPASEVILLKLA